MDGVSVKVTYEMKVDVSAVAEEAATEGLQDVVDVCLEEANQTVPIEEGALGASGNAEVSGLEGQVSYSTVYAVIQHEDDSLKHDAGRRSHWLEATVAENEQRYMDYIADKVRARLT